MSKFYPRMNAGDYIVVGGDNIADANDGDNHSSAFLGVLLQLDYIAK